MPKLIKLLKVKPGGVVNSCDSCPFNYENSSCELWYVLKDSGDKLAMPDVENCKHGDFPKDCMLPDYVDENEFTTQDGIVLIPKGTEKNGVLSCNICHFWKQSSSGTDTVMICKRDEKCPSCLGKERKDGENIAWVARPKLDVKNG